MPTKARNSIPIEVFQVYLNEKIEKYGSKEAVAIRMGISTRRLNEFLTGVRTDSRAKSGTITKVSINVADRIAIKMGDHLIDIDESLYE